MPYKKSKNKDGTYTVSSPTSTHAKHSTKKNAEAQIRLLQALEHDPTFVPRARKKKKARRASRSQY